jgi:hypothetical protein
MANLTQTINTIIDNVSYTWTPMSFIKSSLGNPNSRTWYRKFLYNEVAALNLITAQITIPVPRFKSIVTSKDGVPYLELERIDGINCDLARDKCGCCTDSEG